MPARAEDMKNPAGRRSGAASLNRVQRTWRSVSGAAAATTFRPGTGQAAARSTQGISVLGAGQSIMHNRRDERRWGYAHWLIEMMTEGHLMVRTRSFPWTRISPGMGVLYAPGCWYDERVPGDCAASSSVHMFFQLTDATLHEPLARIVQAGCILLDMDRQVTGLLQHVYEHCSGAPAQQLLAHGCLQQTVALLLLARAEGSQLHLASDAVGADDLVAAAHQYMRTHLAERCQIADVAAHLGLSESGFSHGYRRLAGQAPMAALRRMRIETAKSLVLRGRLTLEQIATQTGFADAFHLSRTFKQLVGQTPSSYRRAHTLG